MNPLYGNMPKIVLNIFKPWISNRKLTNKVKIVYVLILNIFIEFREKNTHFTFAISFWMFTLHSNVYFVNQISTKSRVENTPPPNLLLLLLLLLLFWFLLNLIEKYSHTHTQTHSLWSCPRTHHLIFLVVIFSVDFDCFFLVWKECWICMSLLRKCRFLFIFFL